MEKKKKKPAVELIILLGYIHVHNNPSKNK